MMGDSEGTVNSSDGFMLVRGGGSEDRRKSEKTWCNTNRQWLVLQ